MGFEESRDLIFDVRFTEGSRQAMPEAAATLAKAGVDVIFTTGEAATQAAKAATRKIPIVFTQVGDPVSAGIVMEIAHPGANVTGVASLDSELAPKRLEILKSLVPLLRRVWAICSADDLQSLAAVRRAEEAAPRLRVKLLARVVRTPGELADVLKEVRSGDGLLAPLTAALDAPDQTLKASLSKRAPIIFTSAFWVSYGALASYGADYYDDGYQAARLVAKILRGDHPSDLPVEGTNKIRLVINAKTAKALGLTIPPSVLVRADQIIE